MKTLRIDTTELISGALVIGDTGGGVLGSTIPSSGTSGPGYAYNDLNLPADANKEIMGRVITQPSSGILKTFEDTSFTFEDAADGVYAFTYQLYEDYVPVGSPATVTLIVGDYRVSLQSTSSVTANLSTSVKLNSQLGSQTTLTVSLNTQSGLSTNLTGTVTLNANLSGGASLASALVCISKITAILEGSAGNIKPGDRLSITYLGSPYTITLL